MASICRMQYRARYISMIRWPASTRAMCPSCELAEPPTQAQDTSCGEYCIQHLPCALNNHMPFNIFFFVQ
jgi:hypothetical protein